MERYDIALLGGDARIGYLPPCFLEKGYSVISYGLERMAQEGERSAVSAQSWQEAIEQADYIVGGIPFIKEGKICCNPDCPDLTVEQMNKWVMENQVIFGGVLPGGFVEACKRRGIVCHDFMKDEALAVFNAIATAEGAILEALKNQKTNIHGSKSLVLGYGRCGRVLAEKLKGMGAWVTVCSRCRIELANADALGLDTLPMAELEERVSAYEYIYQTIPAMVLQEKILQGMREDVLIIDIASGAGGVDYDCADALGLRALHCLGLPGKYAPKISAQGLAEFVIRKME
ncbi:MAG: hypothetical protein NC300_06085 [Bacteroidales bacterium]|nr:dipicolinate synthase [Clostridium sp.]MCM1203693.1 hypothetical protein [Bacteroidales bacterium]